MWADALCIDQQNTHERSHQIRIMGDIYRRAASTIIYLGSLQPNGQCLFNHITAKNRERIQLQREPDIEADAPIELKQAVDELFSNDWFTRAWVFQELVLSGLTWHG